MAEPKKINVIYFDESAVKTARFINLCGGKSIIEIAGVFGSFTKVAPKLEEDKYRFLRLLDADVAVLHITRQSTILLPMLENFKKNLNIKLVGLLSCECAANPGITGILDYYTEEAGIESLLSDEDVYTQMIFQIKTARLALNNEEYGVKGKWAIFPPPHACPHTQNFSVIAIGASAGGTEAVTEILSDITVNVPPILLVQHIPDNFTEFFANNLAQRIALKVKIAANGEKLENGTVYIAGCDRHLEIEKSLTGGYVAKCTSGEKISGHRPSVDALFMSVAKSARASAIGVILTGMGNDGARGLLEMRNAGAYTIGQDKETCAVYGMPMVAYNLGAVSKQLPLGSISKAIMSAVTKSNDRRKDNE